MRKYNFLFPLISSNEQYKKFLYILFISIIMKSSKTLTSGTLWGELPARERLKQEVITPDLIENIWRQVLDDTNNPDFDYGIDRQPEYLQ